MACFVAPAAVAVVTTVTRKIVQRRETDSSAPQAQTSKVKQCGKWTQRLGWLNTMLWGGTVMLVLDHILSGELTARPPFLTALGEAGQASVVINEILVVGGAMTGAVFVVWGIMIAAAELRTRAKVKAKPAQDS